MTLCEGARVSDGVPLAVGGTLGEPLVVGVAVPVRDGVSGRDRVVVLLGECVRVAGSDAVSLCVGLRVRHTRTPLVFAPQSVANSDLGHASPLREQVP